MGTRMNLVLASLVALSLSAVSADRGHFVVSSVRPNVSVFGEGQKAIIGWNGTEEVLILSTDMSASAEATVLEFLPLPSKPAAVEKADFTPFLKIQKLIRSHAEKQRAPSTRAETPVQPTVEIVFHEKIGAHDIAIARTSSDEDFVNWMISYVENRGIKLEAEQAAGLRPLVEEYIEDGYSYFVCDVIELGRASKTVEPLMYRFKSDKLYFPLRVSSLDAGRGAIDLFLLTSRRVDVWGTNTGFVSGFYRVGTTLGRPIKFTIPQKAIADVHPALGRLFKDDAWLGVAKYRGMLSTLTRDFIVK